MTEFSQNSFTLSSWQVSFQETVLSLKLVRSKIAANKSYNAKIYNTVNGKGHNILKVYLKSGNLIINPYSFQLSK